jgi:hypothetical protein
MRLVSIKWKPLQADKRDIVVGYAANEPIVLRAQDFELTELRVADYAQVDREWHRRQRNGHCR